MVKFILFLVGVLFILSMLPWSSAHMNDLLGAANSSRCFARPVLAKSSSRVSSAGKIYHRSHCFFQNLVESPQANPGWRSLSSPREAKLVPLQRRDAETFPASYVTSHDNLRFLRPHQASVVNWWRISRISSDSSPRKSFQLIGIDCRDRLVAPLCPLSVKLGLPICPSKAAHCRSQRCN